MTKKSDNKKVDKNVKKIQELETKVVELDNNWKRALADYKNLERRTAQEKLEVIEFSNSVLIDNMLPVLDNFEMIEQHSDDMGIKMSIKEFKQILNNAGLKEVEVSTNDEFDHTTMDAVETVDGPKNKVVEVLRKGYLYKEKLIRPVSVKVGSGE